MAKKSLYSRYVEKMESIKDPYFKNVNEDLFNGQNSYLRLKMKGSSIFNDEWVKAIENCVYELGQIVNNPLEVTKTEGDLVPIELAKKINYESIQHLSSHSQYVKDIDEQGNVIPAKILSQFHKEELHTYENRFIATFIRRLVLFVEKRYEFIKTTVNFDTKDILYIKNKSIVDGEEVMIETKITKKKSNEDTQSKIGREFVKRVEEMRRYVNYFYNSPFMKELKTEKNVRKPILQTNIIRKNPLYHKCYETFLFIEKFSSLGIEYSLDSHYQEFTEKERRALNYILTSNLLSLEATEKSKVYKKSNKVYKPKLLPSCDDEIFTYGDLLKGPIEFVRVDDKYTEYLNKQISPDVPKHPNKVEKEYYKEELELKKNTKKHFSEVDLLLKRIKREITKWEKYLAKLIEERNIEEAKEVEEQLDALRKQEFEILERKRKEIIAAAQGEKDNIKAEELAKLQKEEEKARAKEAAMRKAIEEAAALAIEEVRRAEAQEKLNEKPQEIVEEIKEEQTSAEEVLVSEESQPEVIEEVAEEPKAEEIVEEPEEQPIEAPIKQEQEAIEPVTDEVAPIKEIKEETPVAEEQPVIEEPKEEQPIEETEAFNEQPVSVEELNEVAPVVEEQSAVEEQPVVEEPKAEEKPVEEKKPAAKKASAKKQTTKKTSTKKSDTKKPTTKKSSVSKVKKEEEKPLVEPLKEEPKVVEPVKEVAKEEGAKVLEKPKEAPKKKATPKKSTQPKKSTGKTGESDKPKAPKTTKKPSKKPAKKVEKPKVSEPPKEEPHTVFEKIPGRFIVKSNKGYVISKTQFTNIKSQAHVFDDFNDARRYKTLFGGKVIKL